MDNGLPQLPIVENLMPMEHGLKGLPAVAFAALLACAITSESAQAQTPPVKAPPKVAPQVKPVNPLSQELTEQAKIYQSRGDIVPAEYVIDRLVLS